MSDIRNSLSDLVDRLKPANNSPHNIEMSVSSTDSSNESITKIADKFSEATSAGMYKSLRDGTFNNTRMKTGTSDYQSSAGHFELSMITFNRYDILATYHGCWIFRRIIDRVAQDMWSSGITINASTDPDDLKRVYKRFERLKSELIYGTQQARLFGGAASLMMVDDGETDLTKPLNLRNIKKGARIRLYTTDRWYNLDTSSEKVTNYANVDFNLPKYYTFILDSGESIKVHHSRVLRYTNRRSPKLIEQLLNGWGVSELEHIYQDLINHENTKNSIASLLSKALLEIVKLGGMKSTMQGLAGGDVGSQQMFAGQMAALNEYRSTNNLVFMDKEDDYQQIPYSFGGLSDILESQKAIVAGAAEMPQVLIFGDTKGGMTSDSPAEMEFYAQTILGKQEQEVRPILDKLLPVLFRVEGIEVPKDLDYDFESIAGISQEKRLSLLQATTAAIQSAVDNNMMTHETAIKELQQVEKTTGFGSNISDRDIELARRADEAAAENTDDENDENDGGGEAETADSLTDNDYDIAKEKILKRTMKD